MLLRDRICPTNVPFRLSIDRHWLVVYDLLINNIYKVIKVKHYILHYRWGYGVPERSTSRLQVVVRWLYVVSSEEVEVTLYYLFYNIWAILLFTSDTSDLKLQASSRLQIVGVYFWLITNFGAKYFLINL